MSKYIARAKARFYISLRVIFPLLPYLRRLKNRNITHNSKRNVSVLLWSLLFFEIFESNLLMLTWPTPNIIFICHNTNSTRFTNKRTQLKRVIFLIISSNIIFNIYTYIYSHSIHLYNFIKRQNLPEKIRDIKDSLAEKWWLIHFFCITKSLNVLKFTKILCYCFNPMSFSK